MEYLGFEPSNEEPFYFISYNSEDKNRIIPVVMELDRLGVPMWYDYGIPYDSRWPEVIARRISTCFAVVLFYTAGVSAKKDSYVVKEYEIARLYNKAVYVIKLDEINAINADFSNVAWLLDLTKRQLIDGTSGDLGSICEEVLRLVGDVRSSRSTVAAVPTHLEDVVDASTSGPQKSTKSLEEISTQDVEGISGQAYQSIPFSSCRLNIFLQTHDKSYVIVQSGKSASKDSYSQTSIADRSWQEFESICKSTLAACSPSTRERNIAIKRFSRLENINVAPDDGNAYYDYDDRFKVQFAVNAIGGFEEKFYDSIRVELNPHLLEVSFYKNGSYALKFYPQLSALADFGIDESELAQACARMIAFAHPQTTISVSKHFRRKVYSDYSGGFLLDYIESDET